MATGGPGIYRRTGVFRGHVFSVPRGMIRSVIRRSSRSTHTRANVENNQQTEHPARDGRELQMEMRVRHLYSPTRVPRSSAFCFAGGRGRVRVRRVKKPMTND